MCEPPDRRRQRLAFPLRHFIRKLRILQLTSFSEVTTLNEVIKWSSHYDPSNPGISLSVRIGLTASHSGNRTGPHLDRCRTHESAAAGALWNRGYVVGCLDRLAGGRPVSRLHKCLFRGGRDICADGVVRLINSPDCRRDRPEVIG